MFIHPANRHHSCQNASLCLRACIRELWRSANTVQSVFFHDCLHWASHYVMTDENILKQLTRKFVIENKIQILINASTVPYDKVFFIKNEKCPCNTNSRIKYYFILYFMSYHEQAAPSTMLYMQSGVSIKKYYPSAILG